MRHRKAYRKFGLPSDQRRALLKGLTRAMILNDQIVTTETRAKEVRPIVEKIVTMARKGGVNAPVAARLHTRRMVRRYIDSNVDEFVHVSTGSKGGKKIARNPHYAIPRLFEVIAPRYMNTNGGYTRITKIGFRRGDAAPLVLLEFVAGIEPVESAVEAPAKQEGGRGLFGRRKAKE